ncbi:MAG TPA: leukotriene A4 hydrolase C-terminal domain-containing protein, partial [Thermoanaerobaculia bacterium]|nr:leukotriene A4 hydrolase C-terminal domain-containing protein [Thermoanaerobaculia bacterium]
QVPIEEWIEKPGLPASAPRPKSEALVAVQTAAAEWRDGKTRASALPTKEWTTQEWLHFLRALPPSLPAEKLAELDAAFRLTEAGNSEITNQWLLLAIASGYEPAHPRLERFLTSMGRRKFLKPLYEELVKTPEGKARALAIYRKARPTYHPIAVATVDKIVGWSG